MVIGICVGLAVATAFTIGLGKILDKCQTNVEREAQDRARHGWPIPKAEPPPDSTARVGWGTEINLEEERWTR